MVEKVPFSMAPSPMQRVKAEVITEWKLKRVEETHGDYIEYVYETADEPVRGGLVAKAIYLKEVRAGNSGQSTPHSG